VPRFTVGLASLPRRKSVQEVVLHSGTEPNGPAPPSALAAFNNQRFKMNDIHDLNRFIAAQQGVYESVVQELRSGTKRGHWMWYIFPQIAGLGRTATSQRYAIQSIDEAKAYYEHSVLGSRLRECTRLVIDVCDRTAQQIFGHIDKLKFRSCMTLFDCVAKDEDTLFRDALEKYFDGRADRLTLEILESGSDH